MRTPIDSTSATGMRSTRKRCASEPGQNSITM